MPEGGVVSTEFRLWSCVPLSIRMGYASLFELGPAYENRSGSTKA